MSDGARTQPAWLDAGLAVRRRACSALRRCAEAACSVGAVRALQSRACTSATTRPPCSAESQRCVAGGRDLPAEPLWLEQVHGIDVVEHRRCRAADMRRHAPMPRVAFEPGRVCVVHDGRLPAGRVRRSRGHARRRRARRLARARRGRARSHDRGAAGRRRRELLGVARSGDRAGRVRSRGRRCARHSSRVTRRTHAASQRNAAGRYQADLVRARAPRAARVPASRHVSGGGRCTYSDTRRVSFRSAATGTTGRMATLAWLGSGPRLHVAACYPDHR